VSATALASRIRGREVSPFQVLDATIARIEQSTPRDYRRQTRLGWHRWRRMPFGRWRRGPRHPGQRQCALL